MNHGDRLLEQDIQSVYNVESLKQYRDMLREVLNHPLVVWGSFRRNFPDPDHFVGELRSILEKH